MKMYLDLFKFCYLTGGKFIMFDTEGHSISLDKRSMAFFDFTCDDF